MAMDVKVCLASFMEGGGAMKQVASAALLALAIAGTLMSSDV
jgi:hypothetical protein